MFVADDLREALRDPALLEVAELHELEDARRDVPAVVAPQCIQPLRQEVRPAAFRPEVGFAGQGRRWSPLCDHLPPRRRLRSVRIEGRLDLLGLRVPLRRAALRRLPRPVQLRQPRHGRRRARRRRARRLLVVRGDDGRPPACGAPLGRRGGRRAPQRLTSDRTLIHWEGVAVVLAQCGTELQRQLPGGVAYAERVLLHIAESSGRDIEAEEIADLLGEELPMRQRRAVLGAEAARSRTLV
mmetsp:Transcript_79945/g.258520  ORF Transcript_79945/g.258520 Transcript_79945/m.258520 type:complete len:241 (-) Transcript_79945:878-1600(-)